MKSPTDLPRGLHLYRPHFASDNKVDETRCRASVQSPRIGSHQCPRPGTKLWKSKNRKTYMFCAQHHPDAVTKREQERRARFEAEQRNWNRNFAINDTRRAIADAVLKIPVDELPKKLRALVEKYNRLKAKQE